MSISDQSSIRHSCSLRLDSLLREPDIPCVPSIVKDYAVLKVRPNRSTADLSATCQLGAPKVGIIRLGGAVDGR